MRLAFAGLVALACGPVFAEAHIGFRTVQNPYGEGALITDFYAVSKARSSKLRPRLIVIEIDGIKVKGPKTIELVSKNRKPGDVVKVKVANYEVWPGDSRPSRAGYPSKFEVEMSDKAEVEKGGLMEWYFDPGVSSDP